MDQVKIGEFIRECRNKNNLTQNELAEKLGITDRAISKWENGRAMPDSSLMLDLCKELKITVNDLTLEEKLNLVYKFFKCSSKEQCKFKNHFHKYQIFSVATCV